MAASPQRAWSPPPTAQRWGPGRIIALVVGLLVLLPAIGLLAGGGVLLWADRVARDDAGYLWSSEQSFTSPGYAISSARIDLSTGANWLPLSSALGTARVEVSGADPGANLFIGIAPVRDTSAYLNGVERTVISDLGSGTSGNNETELGAAAPSAPPGEQDFWTAQASGPGPRALTWTPSGGDWTLVVMNADGSADVSVNARIGATVPVLGGVAWELLAGGLFLLVIGGLVVLLAVRRRPAAAAGPYGAGVPMPAGPPPSWAPPAPVDRRTAADARTESPTGVPPQAPPPG
ncbi:MAG: exported protein of unknown function [Blastococcus sp.]|nr:exported protein of unknown function [Blastococcus sp.]